MSSKIDQIYRSILLSKFFKRGWGKPENLRQLFAFRKVLSNRETCQHLVNRDHPFTITKEVDNGDHYILEAEFESPFVQHLPGLLPPESEKAKFQMIYPKKWPNKQKPVCLHLAGTGDHGFWRRRVLMAKPLLQETGIASVILENPFYGCRKPKDQRGSSLHKVSDLFVMGGCLVMESLAIFHWCEKQGLGPLGITGISMGGHMASLAATNWHKPLPLIPCLSWTTASGVFTQGVMSGGINWNMLRSQYFSDQTFRDELFNMIYSPEGHFKVYHEAGQQFARDFPGSLEQIERLKKKGSKNKKHSNFLETAILNKEEQKNGCGDELFSESCVDCENFESREICMVHNKSISGEKCSEFVNRGASTENNVDAVDGLYSVKDNLSFMLSSYFPIPLSWKDSTERTKSALKSKVTHMSNGNRAEQQIFSPVEIRPASASHLPPVFFEPYVKVKDPLTWEVIQFMRGVMDECTHLANFSVPIDPSLAVIVAARKDAYMPTSGIMPLTEIWPGSELRIIKHGHITAYLFNQKVFRDAVKYAFEKYNDKYGSSY